MEKDRKKKIITLLVIVFVTTLSVAFAAMSRTLSINGIAKMDTASWDVHFENLSNARIIRDAEEVNKPYISDDGIMIYDMNVKLTNPKDEIIYTVEIVNSGSIDAEIDSIEMPTFTEQQEKLIDFTAVYNDGTSITEKDFLKAGEKDLITISIKYSDDITEADLPEESLTINLTFKINYIQSDSLVNENSGKTEVKSVLASGGALNTFFNGPLARNTVESIDFLSTMYVPDDALGQWDASQSKNGSVVAWYQDVDKNGLYELYIGGNGKVYAPPNGSYQFYNMNKLKMINFNYNFDTMDIVSMHNMFNGCYSLKELDLSSWNTNNVTNMREAFNNCSSLTSLNLNNIDTSKVINMYQTFLNCKSLNSLDLSSFNLINATNIAYMFCNCSSLTSLNLSSFDTTNVTDMSSMFSGCSSLTTLDVSNFNTSNVTNMALLFNGCSSLTTLDVSSFDTSNVTNMAYIFGSCSSLSELNLSNFITSNVTDMQRMFFGCVNLVNLDISNFNTTNVTTMAEMFDSCKKLTSLDLSHFITINLVSMDNMFEACNGLVYLNLESFNTEKVVGMYWLFAYCTSLETVIFNNADFSNITYDDIMMFKGVKAGCTFYVKDETAKTFILSKKNNANVIIGSPTVFNKYDFNYYKYI